MCNLKIVPCTAGTSSFGMSGVNAHLLLSEPIGPMALPSKAALPWVHKRVWAGPFLHKLVHPSLQQPHGSLRHALSPDLAFLDSFGFALLSASLA